MTSRALVLGGGGSTGAAWQFGVLAGLRDAGVDLMTADHLVGTSVGALVVTNLAVGGSLTEEVDTLLRADRQIDDRLLIDHSPFALALTELIKEGLPAERVRAELGARTLAATDTRSEDELKEIIGEYLVGYDWPERRLLVPAVDAGSGKLTVFDRDSRVPLADALAAASAVPIVWSPITIGDRRYVDAFIRSPTNADLAAGAERVVVIAPIPEIRGLPGSGVAEQIAPLEAHAKVLTIVPDERSRAAIGRGLQELSRQPEAVRAGLDQAAAVTDAARTLWLA